MTVTCPICKTRMNELPEVDEAVVERVAEAIELAMWGTSTEETARAAIAALTETEQ